tara:strand:- start:1221 stop:3041 length:1821 start_codon:yes stop_codon:yes gene_type:complete
MCGIYGYIGNNVASVRDTFKKNLKHRGPDDNGVFEDNEKKLLLGQTRLSIIDLSDDGHQPMSDSSGRYIIVFNGEIYNYQEIKKELHSDFQFNSNSDTEVVLNSYLKWGSSCLNKLRGMFAFCIYDKIEKTLFLARDRFGIKPLIYSFDNNSFVFTSELKPILKSNSFTKKINKDSIIDYFSFGAIQQPKTVLEKFFFLEKAHFMFVNADLSYYTKKYYNYEMESKKINISDNYFEETKHLRCTLEDATKHHLIADVEVGSFLSGGIDSSAITALMSRLSYKKIKTFSLGFKDAVGVFDESAIAARTAKYLDTDHHEIKIDDDYVHNIIESYIESIDQPTFDGINTYIISRETAKNVKVTISGIAGDELFAGYSHFNQIQRSRTKAGLFDSFKRNYLGRLVQQSNLKYLDFIDLNVVEAVTHKRLMTKNVKDILQNVKPELNKQTNFDEISDLTCFQNITKSEFDGYLLNTLLRDGDVLSMANSLEVRPILLDHKLVEHGFAIPDNYKIRDGLNKSILIDAVKDIIPSEVMYRAKTGFVMPLGKWLNGGLNKQFNYMLEQSVFSEEIFKKDYLFRLKNRIRTRTLIRKDWMMFVFLYWLNQYEFDL